MDKFNCYLKQHVREAFVKGPVSLDEAKKFLEKNKYGLVKNFAGTRFFDLKYIEEEENAKNIGSINQPGHDYETTGGHSVSEDSDRELFRFNTDNSE
jgi:hypothetical protein